MDSRDVDRIVEQLKSINNTLEYTVGKKRDNAQVDGCLGWLIVLVIIITLIVTGTWPAVLQGIYNLLLSVIR